MKFFSKWKKVTLCLAMVLVGTTCFNSFVSIAKSTGYFNTYTDVCSINNTKYTTSQGFATGTKYAYSAKINGKDGDRAMLFRIDMSSKKTVKLINGDETDSKTNTYMGHANDMTVYSKNNIDYLFIATSTDKLIKVRIDGDKYSSEAEYNLRYKGKSKKINGIDIIRQTSKDITFLFKEGNEFYEGTVAVGATKGDVELTHKFTIDVTNALVNGNKITDIHKYTPQGFCYSNGLLYVPLWGGGVSDAKRNISVILVYKYDYDLNKIENKTDLSFRITSSKYSEIFEIESCDIHDGMLWFNTNRAEDKATQADGVHYFKDYVQ